MCICVCERAYSVCDGAGVHVRVCMCASVSVLHIISSSAADDCRLSAFNYLQNRIHADTNTGRHRVQHLRLINLEPALVYNRGLTTTRRTRYILLCSDAHHHLIFALG